MPNLQAPPYTALVSPSFLYVALFSAAIAGLLWVMQPSVSFWSTMAISQIIGFTINLSFVLFGDLAENYMNPYIAPIPIVAIGLASSLVVAGSLVVGEPWFFFVDKGSSTILVGVFFGIVGFLMFGTHARLLRAKDELARAATEQERQRALIVNTELRLLQAQIEPHFLFNTLSNIIGLIHKEPDLAEQTLLNLTTLLRSSLDRTRSAETTLAEEIEISRAYLEIQSIRMQGRLSYNIDYDPALKNLPLAPLLVQPLVENAIKHGIDPLEQGGEISISATVEDKCAIICVADNGRGIDPHKPPSTHSTGLANVRDRLDALYLNNASLKLTENPPSGVRATLTLPLST